VVSAGYNFNIWQWQTYELEPNGQIVAHIHKYTEIASGLNVLDTSNGQYVPAQSVIEPYANGAVAQRGQHKIIYSYNINTPGAIDELTTDGQRLAGGPISLIYYDPTTGESATVALIQDSEGQLIGANGNQVIYTNAFNGGGVTQLAVLAIHGLSI